MGANAETDVWTYTGSTLKVCVCVCDFCEVQVHKGVERLQRYTLSDTAGVWCERGSLIKQKLETFSFSSFLNVTIFCFSPFYIIVSVSMVFRRTAGYNKICEDITMTL